MSEERFTRSTVETLAKRAANTCSNPECGAVTSGPADEGNRAITVGEAAHIYGARPGSARFESEMGSADRSDITNGIWLCRNCHKIVDADRKAYPPEILFEWRRDHERTILGRLGKSGALRQKVQDRRLEDFEGCSYLAQQIIIDKPDYWEYKLTAEFLRVYLGPIRKRWMALERGLYALPITMLTSEQALPWFKMAMTDACSQTSALSGLLNGELQASWGPPGEPGSEHEIRRVCELIGEACRHLLEWEEKIRFLLVEGPLENLPEVMQNACGPNLEKVCEIPDWMNSIFKADPTKGKHEMKLVFDVPEGWADRINAALQQVER